MKLKTFFLLFLAVGIATGERQNVSAQDPSPAAPAHGSVPTFVYLKQDYVDALKPSGIVRDNPLTAVFLRFDNDFAVFKRPESNASIYVPKSAVLYISAKPEPGIKF